MFKKILLATIAVVSLAGAAHAQTTSIDAVCARPDLTPPQQIMCSSHSNSTTVTATSPASYLSGLT